MALAGFLPPSSYNTGSALVRASTRKVVIKKSNDESFKGAITKSFKKSDIATTEKKSGALVYTGNKKDATEEQIIRVKVKVIKLRDIFKDRYVYDKIKDKKETRDKTNEDKKKREKELEGKKKSNKFNIGKLGALMPKTGIFDWITNFLLYTILGYLNNRFEIIPKLVGLIPLIEKSMSFIINIGGILLNGLTTFIDFGYGLVDKTKGFIKAIGGDGAAKVFDKFLGTLNTLFNLALIAAMINAGGGFGGKRKGGGAPKGGVKPGGKPKVTTSGGRTAGKPDIRNPLRQKPKVTTGTGGGKGSRLPKLPKGIKAKGAGLLGMAFIIPDLIESGMLAKEGRGKDGLRTLINAVSGTGAGMAASAATLAGAGALGLTGVGLPAAIALGIASLGVGTVAGTAAYNASDAGLRKMGLVDTDPKTGKPYQYAFGGVIGKASAGLPGIGGMMSLPPMPKLTLPNLVPTLIGNAIGGVKKLFSFFGVGTEDEAKSSSEPLINLANKVKDIPLIGGAMYAALQLALGMRVDRNVLKYVGAQFTNFSNLDAFKGISASTSRLSSALKFEEGGQVTSTVVSLSQSDNMKSVNSLATYLDRELGSIELEIEEEKRKQEEEQEGSQQELDQQPGGQLKVTGGNADFWTLVAIASREDGDPQGWADVAQSIYNRVASGVYGAKTIQGIVTREGQYEPTWKYPYAGKRGKPNKEWYNIKDAASAAKATGMSVGAMNSVAAALRNKKYQTEAAKFIGGRTDFMGGGNQPGPGDIRRKENSPNNFFGWFVGPAAIAYGKKNPGPAVTPQLGNIAVMETKPQGGGGGGFLSSFQRLFGGGDQGGGDIPKGSVVQWLHGNPNRKGYDSGHAGQSNAHDHFSFKSRGAAVNAFKKLKASGYNPYEFEGFTRVGDHSPSGGHYGPVGGKPTYNDPTDGTAFDIPWATYGSGAIGKKDYDLSYKAAKIVGAAQGGGYIGKNLKAYKGVNESASYEQSGVLLMIQPMIIEKPSERPISYGSNVSKTTFAGSGSVNSGYNPAASRG